MKSRTASYSYSGKITWYLVTQINILSVCRTHLRKPQKRLKALQHKGYKAFKLVGLSGADYNSYKTIIRAKRKVAKNYGLISAPNLTEGAEIENRKIGIFGEVEVKQRCQSQKRLSPEEKERVVLGHKADKTIYKLAEEFGCHRQTISSVLKQHGIKPDKCKAQKKLDIAKVIAMYEKEQQTLDQIAQYFGVSSHTISTCLRNNGVKIRSRWDYATE